MNTGNFFLRQGVNTLKITHLLIVLSVLVFKMALLKSYLGHKQMLAALHIPGNEFSAQYFFATRVLEGLPFHNYYISVRTYAYIYS